MTLASAALLTALAATLLAGCAAGLHQAVRNRDLAGVTQGIQEGADLNALDAEGLAPLHIAASHPNIEIVRALLDAGADPNLASQKGDPPLTFAAENKAAGEAVIRLLLERKADPNGGGHGTPSVLKAVQADNVPALKLLAEAGADLGAHHFGVIPLVSAIQQKNRPMVEHLIALGADVNLRIGNTRAPIGHASATADLELVRLLLDAGADPNYEEMGETPLTLAVITEHQKMVQLLLERGADPNVKGQGAFFYPIHRAILNDTMPILELLLAHGADPMVRDNYRRTALDVAKGLLSPVRVTRYTEVIEKWVAMKHEQRWSATQQADSVIAYRQYLGKYPDSPHAEVARARIATLLREADDRAFAQARDAGSPDGLRDYLSSDPHGAYREQAVVLLAKLYPPPQRAGVIAALVGQYPEHASILLPIAWETTMEMDSRAGYQAFLKAFPDSPHRAAALARLDNMRRAQDDNAFAAAKGKGSQGAWRAYLRENPHGHYRRDALLALVGLAGGEEDRPAALRALTREYPEDAHLLAEPGWELVRGMDTAAAYSAYLSAYPDTHHRGVAESRLAALEQERDDRAFARAAARKEQAAWREYLRDFPEGRHRPEAYVSLIDSVAPPQRPEAIVALIRDYPDSAGTLPSRHTLYFIGPEGLQVRDLLDMRRQGLAPSVLATMVATRGEPYRRFTPEEVLELDRLGVEAPIIDAMLKATHEAEQAEARRKSEQQRTEEMAALRTQLAEMQSELERLRSEQRNSTRGYSGNTGATAREPSAADTVASCAQRLTALEGCKRLPFPANAICEATAKSNLPCPIDRIPGR
jgi:ankyrin repeat protein